MTVVYDESGYGAGCGIEAHAPSKFDEICKQADKAFREAIEAGADYNTLSIDTMHPYEDRMITITPMDIEKWKNQG